VQTLEAAKSFLFDYLVMHVVREEGLEFEMPLDQPEHVQEHHQRMLKLYNTLKELLESILQHSDEGTDESER
jgi:hypothetical protein